MNAHIVIPLTAVTFYETFHTEVVSGLFSLRWAILLICMLVFTDFWSGLTASVKIKKEKFRKSRAIRRTLTKFCEYISYLIFGIVIFYSCLYPFGVGNPTQGASVAALFVVYCEADSIYEHICDIHGWQKRFSIKKFFISFIKHKNKDVGEAVEDALGDDDNEVKKEK